VLAAVELPQALSCCPTILPVSVFGVLPTPAAAACVRHVSMLLVLVLLLLLVVLLLQAEGLQWQA
jgi:hypothetical protein